MKSEWKIQEAGNNLSEVIDKAVASGPQIITRRGKKIAVILSFGEFQRLQHDKEGLVDFFQRSPLAGISTDRQADLPPPASTLPLLQLQPTIKSAKFVI